MEILQLKYFCDAAETENFSKTAKKYFVPTSNISQSIKRLENELGCELFEHKSNKITLNSDGKRFYAEVSQALALLDNEKKRLADRDNNLCGDIRLICLNNRRTVAGAIEKFMELYPNVNFIIHHNFESESDFDVIVSDTCPYEYSQKILLVDEDICIAMNKNHPLVNKAPFSIADLKHERFITMTAGSSLQKITVSACEAAGFTPNIAIQTDVPFYVQKYVEMNLGVAFVPTHAWQGQFSDDIVLRKTDNIRRKTYAFLPKQKYIKRSVETFLRILKDEADNCQK